MCVSLSWPGKKCLNWGRFGWGTLPPFFWTQYIAICIQHGSALLCHIWLQRHIYRMPRIPLRSIHLHQVTHWSLAFYKAQTNANLNWYAQSLPLEKNTWALGMAWKDNDKAQSAASRYASIEPLWHHFVVNVISTHTNNISIYIYAYIYI